MRAKDDNPGIKRRKINLIEIVIILALMAIIGNIIYQLLHWREAYEGMKSIGLAGTIAIFLVVFAIKRWISKL